MKLIFAYFFSGILLAFSNLCYAQAFNYPHGANDTIQFEYSFVHMNGSFGFTIYYEYRPKEDFKSIMNLNSGKGNFSSYDSIMAIHFKLLKYMRDNGFDLLGRQWVKGEKIDLFGSDIEYEFVFRRAKKKEQK